MKQFFQVNWVNGMKITSDHFIELENHFVYRLQNSLKGLVNDLSYGLLPSQDLENNPPKFSISLNDNKIKALRSFSMLSPDGDFIQIPPNVDFKLVRPVEEATRYYLVITGDPYSRMRIGQVNELESPLRSPYSMPEYVFQFLSAQSGSLNTLGRTIVPVGKYNGGSFEEDLSYIPPCTSIQSHPALSRLGEDVKNKLTELVRKVEELRKKSNVTNKEMLFEMVRFFNQNLTAILWYTDSQAPVFLSEKVHQVARIFHFAIINNNLQVKEEYARLLSEFVNFQYNHLEIGLSIEIVRKFISNFQNFLPKDDTSFGV
jgi:hypothetical protein